ncbi:MAG: hypothetical protein WC159_02890 [Sphaerochaetaceae bacterium]
MVYFTAIEKKGKVHQPLKDKALEILQFPFILLHDESMQSNLWGLLYSVFFLSAVIALSFALGKWGGLSPMGVRKLVHMGVSNWWFIEMSFFTQVGYALIGPVCFVVLNSLFVLFKKGESESHKNLGLIYFPVSLIVLVLLQYNRVLSVRACLCGVLVMGYGDSLAAIIGQKWGKDRLPWFFHLKSYQGTIAMFLVSLVVACLVLGNFAGALVVALVASVVEAITPYGLDNMSVPLLVAFIAGVYV